MLCQVACLQPSRESCGDLLDTPSFGQDGFVVNAAAPLSSSLFQHTPLDHSRAFERSLELGVNGDQADAGEFRSKPCTVPAIDARLILSLKSKRD